ncbi:MAG: penicillin-binding protein activator LpoB [Gemmatimonadota bacterium]
MTRRVRALPLVVLGSLVSILPACASRQVTRVEPATQIDLSGRWNDTDSRLVAEQMIDDVLSSSSLNAWQERPVVVLGPVRNETLEHIATETFLNDVERALAASGRVIVVAGPEDRDSVRREREEQQVYARPSTRAATRAETGADLLLGGVISAIEDREDGKQVVYYQVDLSLTDLESNEKIWLGQKKLKKYVGRGRYKA